MTAAPIVRIAALALLALAWPASARGAAFEPAQALDLRVSGPVAAAVGPRGEAVVAGVGPAAPAGRQVEVAMRAGPGAPWKVMALGPIVSVARDVQAVVARGRAVVAWGEVRRREQAVVVATGHVGGALTVRRTGASSPPGCALCRSARTPARIAASRRHPTRTWRR
jgi:hypothetical protein